MRGRARAGTVIAGTAAAWILAAALCLAGCGWKAGKDGDGAVKTETEPAGRDAAVMAEEQDQKTGLSESSEGNRRGGRRCLRPSIPGLGRILVKAGRSLDRPGGYRSGQSVGLRGGDNLCEALPAGNGTMGLLVSVEFARDVLEISVLEYEDSRILMQQGEICAGLETGSSVMSVSPGAGSHGVSMVLGEGGGKRPAAPAAPKQTLLECGPVRKNGRLYLPLESICRAFGYRTETEPGSLVVYLEDESQGVRRKLPSAYDYRRTGRDARVRDQGSYGTCWSFASLTALETAMRPGESMEFSADHMSLRNSFSLDQRQGGEYTMSMAYLLAWQGPVLEEEDPYGDNISPEGLAPAVHVQEIQLLPSKDLKAVKKAVFLRGGVQSSLHTSIVNSRSRSDYYSVENSAYCYQGEEIPNHDVVIVGWDDDYPKENFQIEPPGDGAFLCVSSWGQDFGEGGYFHVSYYDSNIGGNGLVYTKIQAPDNYDRIYQTDLCGWVGHLGYSAEKAYGANVYQAREAENLEAVGFYAIGENTSYSIYAADHVGEEAGFEHKKLAASGTLKYRGFYTIPLDQPVELEAGERFALILEVETPDVLLPLAVEYQADEVTAHVDVTDGEGYISSDGQRWESLEERHQCNLCLKAYTTVRNVQK